MLQPQTKERRNINRHRPMFSYIHVVESTITCSGCVPPAFRHGQERRRGTKRFARDGEGGRYCRCCTCRLLLPRPQKKHKQRSYATYFLVSPLSWALEPECEILIFMWSFGPKQGAQKRAMAMVLLAYK